ncbi:MAG TPA: hypothetical protein VNQ73_05780 [Ilumatobacter sp.]|nr:hypothetical protein [Ilumatobacter sp.]
MSIATPGDRTRTTRPTPRRSADRTRPEPRRPGRTVTITGAAVLTATLLAACGGASDPSNSGGTAAPTTASSAAASAEPTTPRHTAPAATVAATTVAEPDPVPTDPETPLLDELLASRVDGQVPLDGALSAFAALYGDLPGVTAPALDPEGLEGTTAVRWLAAHRSELTDAQATAVDAAMTPLIIDGTPLAAGQPPAPSGFRAARGSTPSSPQTGCFGGAFPFADAPGAGKYRDLVRLALAELSLLMGPLDIPVYTAFSQFERINADLNPWGPDCGQPAQACQIRLAPLALKMSESTLMKTLAHELVHCYQARAVGATSISKMPDWLIEGFPSFVAETVGQSIGNTTPNYWWDKWFKRPGVQLYGRTYDALGFYAVVQQAGGDPFRRYIPALLTRDNSAAYQELIGGVADHFGTIWGATHFRQPERGLFWDLDGPGVTGYRPALPPSTITNGGGNASALDEAQAAADLFDLRAEVVIIELAGPIKARASFAGQADEVITGPQEWCTLGYPCVCPDDTARAGTIVDQAPAAQLAIGAAGIAAGGTLHVTGMSFDDYCGPQATTTTQPPVPPAVDSCLIGSWTSTTWTIAGPPGLNLDLVGGAGIAMAINREGLVTTDFSGMAAMNGFIPQHQSGTATQEITAAGGTVDELTTITEMSIGPGVFAVWSDSTRYVCGPDSFELIGFNPVESVDVVIPFIRTG